MEGSTNNLMIFFSIEVSAAKSFLGSRICRYGLPLEFFFSKGIKVHFNPILFGLTDDKVIVYLCNNS